ncbi:MAG: A/G-specific adenine glycosylase [Candidatus Diapherotrites archaeon]|nr:A/G-specific adenine glycosylase [Candidatus Diapherotrites archaeon]
METKFPAQKLLNWLQKNQRNLPWRKQYNPYEVWVSEVMLQQTRMDQAVPYFELFIKQFPNLESLAKAKEDSVLKAWEGLGYYSRARNLHQAAKEIVNQLDGKIPRTKNELEKLPGFGPYISSAVASIAFEQNEAVVDGNVVRVLSRFYGLNKSLQERTYFSTIAEKILPKGKARNFNQGLMELGALICLPKNPECMKCPLQENCYAFENKAQEKFPKKIKKKKVPVKKFIGLVLEQNRKLFLRKRTEQGLLKNLWEFPLIETKPNFLDKAELEQKIKKELNLEVKLEKGLGKVKHSYTHFKQEVWIWKAKIKENNSLQFFSHNQIRKLALSKVNHKILEKWMTSNTDIKLSLDEIKQIKQSLKDLQAGKILSLKELK